MPQWKPPQPCAYSQRWLDSVTCFLEIEESRREVDWLSLRRVRRGTEIQDDTTMESPRDTFKILSKNLKDCQVVVAHAWSPSTQGTEAGGSL